MSEPMDLDCVRSIDPDAITNGTIPSGEAANIVEALQSALAAAESDLARMKERAEKAGETIRRLMKCPTCGIVVVDASYDGHCTKCEEVINLRKRMNAQEAEIEKVKDESKRLAGALRDPLRQLCDIAAQIGADVIGAQVASEWMKRELGKIDAALQDAPATEENP